MNRLKKWQRNRETAASALERSPLDRNQTSKSHGHDDFGLEVLFKGDSPSVDVIAIHGLDGHRIKSWTADNGAFWLRDLLPKHMPKARIMTYGYNAYTRGRQQLAEMSIFEHGQALIHDVASHRKDEKVKDRPIIFIAHSLGGLVLKAALLSAHAASPRHLQHHKHVDLSTAGICFLGTPHQGSDGASWMNILLNFQALFSDTTNGVVKDLRPLSKYLEQQLEQYRAISFNYPTVFCYETLHTDLPVGREMIVPRRSAVVPGHYDAPTFALQGNHITIAKFEDNVSSAYTIVSRALRDLEKDASSRVKGRWESDGPQPRHVLNRLTSLPKMACDVKGRTQASQAFEGRSDVLLKMHECFQTHEDPPSGPVKQRRFLLYGLGGAGKTQITLKFIEEAQHRFSQVFFLTASSNETLDSGFMGIARDAHAGNSAKDGIAWLASQPHQWLLVLDNADDAELDLSPWIPSCTHGNVLITSRNRECRIHAPSHFAEIGPMVQQEAIQLLLRYALADKRSTASENDIPLATAIVNELGCLALAIVQAGSYIANCSSLSSYPAVYRKSRADLLGLRSAQGSAQYERTVYTTWEMSFEKLSENAKYFLALCSFLHFAATQQQIFQVAIDRVSKLPVDESNSTLRRFLTTFRGVDGSWDEYAFNLMISELGRYSLVDMTIGSTYSVHPLVHTWARDRLNDDERRSVQSAAIRLLASCVNWGFENVDYTFRRQLLGHVTVALEGQQIDDIDRSQLKALADIYDESGQWGQIVIIEAEIVRKDKSMLGDSHPDTLVSVANLASTYRDQGRWTEAEALEVEVLEKRKTMLGEDHPDTLMSMANLASTYSNQGRWADAEALEVEVLQQWKMVLGDSHPDTLRIMGNLASTYRYQGRWTEAEMLEVEVLEKQKTMFGDIHPDTLRSIANLASTYTNQGRWADAEALQVEVLEKRKTVLGEDHPETLMSMACLATTYWNQGQWTEAEALEVEVLAKRKTVLGEDHPDTLMSMGNLALTYSNQDRWTEAEALGAEAVEKQKTVLGEDHPDTLTSIANLALTYSNQGRWADAEALEDEVLEKKKTVLGKDHPETLISMGNLASTYWNQGRWTEAEALEVEVLEKKKTVLGEDHPDTLFSMANLATTYSDQGRWADAEELQVHALEKQKMVLGNDHPITLMSAGNLAWIKAGGQRRRSRWKFWRKG